MSTAPHKVEALLDDARAEIAVTDQELTEARDRRNRIKKALKKAFPASTTYDCGSVAHGDANTPLKDVDTGVVVAGAEEDYGPGGDGPRPLMNGARDGIREELESDYPNLRIAVEGQTHAVGVSFGDPVDLDENDFTADVIVTVDNTDSAGIYIPDLPTDGWEPSHPAEHTRLMKQGNRATGSVLARTVRLLKYWNGHHGSPLCSWNIKVLALKSITKKVPLAQALLAFFEHAAKSLRDGLTDDPAGVSDPIELNLPLEGVLERVDDARDLIEQAINAEDEGRPYLAQHKLAALLPEIVPDADADDLRREEINQQKAHEAADQSRGVGTGSSLLIPSTRGWSD
ncbi:MAG: nucleotidyltransferase [Actinobacteria bacterium]|nr:nucleotidyltransferase [Actinomycetota bacterium]